MLHDFVAENREELIRRCRAKVEVRSVPPPTPAELEFGVPRFLDQLVDALRNHLGSNLAIHRSAAQHGRDLQLQGFTVSQVVHDYGDVCQSITELAIETGAPISVGDFRILNRCLDDAIASAVTEYGRERPLLGADISAPSERERVGFLVHEIRNLVNAATVAFEVLNTGNVGVSGSTGAVLKRSLSGLRDLINRAVAEVRLGQGLQDRVTIGVAEFIDELTPAAILEAANRGLRFTVHAADANVAVQADRQILSAIVTNLLQNAFKFTRPRTSVSLRVIASADRGTHRDRGRMRRPRGRERRGVVSAFRTTECGSDGPRSRTRVQPMGRRSERRPDLNAQSPRTRVRVRRRPAAGANAHSRDGVTRATAVIHACRS